MEVPNEGVQMVPGTLKAIRDMPDDLRSAFGHALHIASLGGRADGAKPMKGLGFRRP